MTHYNISPSRRSTHLGPIVRPFSLAMLTFSAMIFLHCASVQAENKQESKQENTLTIGAGAAYGSRYSGSNQNRVGPALLLDYQMQNGLFASTMRGLGYGGQIGDLNYSAALAYRDGRSDNDNGGFSGSGSKQLHGMGDIKGSALAMLSLDYTVTKWLSLSAVAELPLSQRENGKAVHLGITGILYQSEQDKLSLGGTASLGDTKYLQTYYGVTAKQSANSGFGVFKPKSGLYAMSTDISWRHQFDQRWAVTTAIGATQLTGDAGKSPIIRRKVAPTAAAYVSYSY